MDTDLLLASLSTEAGVSLVQANISCFGWTGERLSPWVAVGCFTMGVSVIFF